ncbi:hypothetical protein ACM55I_06615 [Flavobacterium sp. GB2R13]|uniref:hypothetical protein n=1 Tax=Flavobacterium algoris TaxID=3398733 RepID=UPI003A8C6AB0
MEYKNVTDDFLRNYWRAQKNYMEIITYDLNEIAKCLELFPKNYGMDINKLLKEIVKNYLEKEVACIEDYDSKKFANHVFEELGKIEVK